MITFYTTVGTLVLRERADHTTYPIVRVGSQDYGLTPEELVLWSCLTFQILNIEELKTAYLAGLEKQKMTSAATFEYFLRRLTVRQLVVSGSGLLAADALYMLLAKLHICPVKDSFFLRLFTCIRLHTEAKLPIADFQKHLKKPENSKLEKLILKMSQELSFTVAELLDHVETTQTDERNSWELPEVASELPIINPVQMPILQAVGNLYLQKQILFFT